MKKPILLSLLLFITVSCSTIVNNGSDYNRILAATGPSSCANLVHAFFRTNEVEIPSGKLAKVKTLGKSIGLTQSEVDEIVSYDAMISSASKKIYADKGAGLEASDEMAKFFQKLRKFYADSDLSDQRIRDLDFVTVTRVLRAESYTVEEMVSQTAAEHIITKNSHLKHISLSEYKEFTLAFKRGEPPYSNLDMSGGTVITRTDIREIQAMNKFPVFLAHDMTHIRHGFLNERYMPTLYEAARSKNHLRYVMLGALSEGADSFQYAEERAICKYFYDKGMDLEEAMMYLGRAPMEEVKRIAEETGSASTFRDLASNFDNWSPKITDEFPGTDLDIEIDNAIKVLRQQNQSEEVTEEFSDFNNRILF
jgi:hypothetical protein